MLATRVITAVVALLVVVGLVFLASRAVWSLFMLAVALIACWEWSRLTGLAAGGRAAFLALSALLGIALGALFFAAEPQRFSHAAFLVFVVAAVFWIAIAPLWIARHLRPGATLAALAGWVVVWPTWMACVVLRDEGPWILLGAAALVWVADIAAYFSGRRFGRRKLAPAVSPGKTWEGLVGALVGVIIYAIVLAAIAHAREVPFAQIFAPAAGIPAIAAMVVLALLSVVGDLFESWMKRGVGRKDSGALLPGHGGVLDRVDALTSTLPVAALAIMVMQWT